MHYQYIYGETDDLVKVKEVWLVEGVEVMALIQSNFFLFKVSLHRSFIKEGRFDQASSGCICICLFKTFHATKHCMLMDNFGLWQLAYYILFA